MSNGTLAALWRYPVKSMAGEELDLVDVSVAGLAGDRAWALVGTLNGKVGSAKSVQRFGDLLKCQAEFLAPPKPGAAAPPVRITWPDGRSLRSDQPDAAAVLAEWFGPEVSLLSIVPSGLMLEFAAGTLGGKHAETTAVPVAEGAPPGTLFDYASIHIVTTATLRSLAEAYPAGNFAVQRFRPNLVVDSGDESGFVENAWCGRVLAIGPELRVRVSIPCPRCVMPNLPRVDLPLDPGILRTAAQVNKLDLGDFGELPCVGVYADVIAPGRISRGDTVRFAD